jgi:hypothetical protein
MRVLGALLGGVFFFQNVVFANVPETNFWLERHKQAQRVKENPFRLLEQLPPLDHSPRTRALSPTLAHSLPKNFGKQNADLLAALSPAYGTLRKIITPETPGPSQTVIHIQDVHQNQEAQENIGKTLQNLLDRQTVGLVALEGSSGTIDLSGFRSFSDQGTIRDVADFFLRENKISGPIHAALSSPVDIPPILGIDDPIHYQANVDAYRLSAPLAKQIQDKIAGFHAGLEKEKALVFSPILLAFDRQIQSYNSGEILLGEYIKTVVASSSPSSHPQSSLFLDALNRESSLDFAQVEKERSRLMESLVERLREDQTQNLIETSLTYRSGHISYADFYNFLGDLCRQNHVDLARFPTMDAYIRYVLLADKIDVDPLMDELHRLESSAYGALAKTPEEKRLVKESRQIHLTARLVDFALTPEEWKEYKNVTRGARGRKDTLDLVSFENFYQEAETRDQAMAANLLKAMEEKKTSVAVLVTGGFHGPGLDDLLRQAGMTTLVFTPKLTKVDTAQGSAYLSVFSQEKAPLDKLAQREHLFLSEHSFSPGNQFRASLATAALQTWKGKFAIPAKEHLKKLTQRRLDNVGLKTNTLKDGNGVELYLKFRTHEFRIRIGIAGNREILSFDEQKVPRSPRKNVRLFSVSVVRFMGLTLFAVWMIFQPLVARADPGHKVGVGEITALKIDNYKPYRPSAWTPEETKQINALLRELREFTLKYETLLHVEMTESAVSFQRPDGQTLRELRRQTLKKFMEIAGQELTTLLHKSFPQKKNSLSTSEQDEILWNQLYNAILPRYFAPYGIFLGTNSTSLWDKRTEKLDEIDVFGLYVVDAVVPLDIVLWGQQVKTLELVIGDPLPGGAPGRGVQLLQAAMVYGNVVYRPGVFKQIIKTGQIRTVESAMATVKSMTHTTWEDYAGDNVPGHYSHSLDFSALKIISKIVQYPDWREKYLDSIIRSERFHEANHYIQIFLKDVFFYSPGKTLPNEASIHGYRLLRDMHELDSHITQIRYSSSGDLPFVLMNVINSAMQSFGRGSLYYLILDFILEYVAQHPNAFPNIRLDTSPAVASVKEKVAGQLDRLTHDQLVMIMDAFHNELWKDPKKIKLIPVLPSPKIEDLFREKTPKKGGKRFILPFTRALGKHLFGWIRNKATYESVLGWFAAFVEAPIVALASLFPTIEAIFIAGHGPQTNAEGQQREAALRAIYWGMRVTAGLAVLLLWGWGDIALWPSLKMGFWVGGVGANILGHGIYNTLALNYGWAQLILGPEAADPNELVRIQTIIRKIPMHREKQLKIALIKDILRTNRINLGVENFQDLTALGPAVVKQMVKNLQKSTDYAKPLAEAYGVQDEHSLTAAARLLVETSATVEGTSFSRTSQASGPRIYFVDSRDSLGENWGPFVQVLSENSFGAVITADPQAHEDLTTRGVKSLYRPDIFQRQTETPDGLTRVSLIQLEKDREFTKLWRELGAPQLFHTSIVVLDTQGVTREDFALAAETALIITSALKTFPPAAIPWEDVLAVLRAIARFA